MNLPEVPTPSKHKAPWWAAIITTLIMALGGASGAIMNYLDSRDARRTAARAKESTAVHSVWLREQGAVYEKQLADLKADVRVNNAIIEGLKSRIDLLERRGGESVVRASRRYRVEPDKAEARKEAEKEFDELRPPKPAPSDPRVQKIVKDVFE